VYCVNMSARVVILASGMIKFRNMAWPPSGANHVRCQISSTVDARSFTDGARERCRQSRHFYGQFLAACFALSSLMALSGASALDAATAVAAIVVGI
jgi:LSD1 subclass zinc finger protein